MLNECRKAGNDVIGNARIAGSFAIATREQQGAGIVVNTIAVVTILLLNAWHVEACPYHRKARESTRPASRECQSRGRGCDLINRERYDGSKRFPAKPQRP